MSGTSLQKAPHLFRPTLMLVTTYGLMFGIGATLTGLVLTLEDES